MNRALRNGDSAARQRSGERVEAPLVWTFDGPFATCLTDMEDTLRRAIVQVGDVSRIAVLIDLSLPALKPRVDAGDAIQPAWGHFSIACAALRPAAAAARAPSRRWRARWRRWSSPTGAETCRSKDGSCSKVNRLFTRVDLPPRATPLGQAVMRRAASSASRSCAPPAATTRCRVRSTSAPTRR